jgi:hypothetical protein
MLLRRSLFINIRRSGVTEHAQYHDAFYHRMDSIAEYTYIYMSHESVPQVSTGRNTNKLQTSLVPTAFRILTNERLKSGSIYFLIV